jgi:predicted transposase/invertase (TIGR01784 family)
MAEKSDSAAQTAAQEPELLPPANDVVFKYVFGDERNKGVTAKLLSAIMGAEIGESDITFGDPHLKREFIDDKLGILDMFVRLKNGETVAVEMLTGNFSNIHKRLEYYISKLTAAQLGNGNEYPKLKPVVFILIATDPVLKNTDKYHSEFAMMEKNEHYVLHDLRTLHIIELSKLPPNSHGRLVSWLKFILAKRKEELVTLVKENPELQYACNVLVEANLTAEVRTLYEIDLKRWRDEQDRTEYAVKAAMKKAEIEKDAALKEAAAEKDAAVEHALALVKQGYPVEQIKAMLRKKD